MQRLNLKYYVLALLLLLGSTSLFYLSNGSSKENQEGPYQEIDQLIKRHIENRAFNGAILVAKGEEILYKKGIGLANMEWDIPNTSRTKFRLGSITKQFTTMAIMQLVSEGKLDLHEPISSYLEDYPVENAKQITIHHLMTHSSGIPNNYSSEYVKETRPDSEPPQKLVDEFSELELEFSPGEKFSYSNAGYQVLGLIIEKVTGKRYEEVLEERIFEPLGMDDTGFDKHRNLIERRADGYFNSFGKYFNSNYVNMSKVYAAGALYSTVEDMYKWDQALYTEKLLAKEYMDLIFQRHIEDPDYGGHYGYAWSIKEKQIGNSNSNFNTYSHDGVIDGFCAVFTRIPAEKATIILLSNVRRAPLNGITRAIMGILSDHSYDLPRKSLAYSSHDIIQEEGLEEGITYFKKNQENTDFYVAEDEVNIVSYLLFEAEKPEAAAQILELGVKYFPNAFNLYDSYGEILRNLGRIDESIINYKKSIDLNPKNQNGIRMLQEMGVDYP